MVRRMARALALASSRLRLVFTPSLCNHVMALPADTFCVRLPRPSAPPLRSFRATARGLSVRANALDVEATVDLGYHEHHEHPEVIRTRFPKAGDLLDVVGTYDDVGRALQQPHAMPNDPYPEIKAEMGYVHSTESFSAVDGPGMRFLVFLQGCAFRCLFCSNPDTWAMHTGDQISSKVIAAKIDHVLPYLKTSGGGVTCSGGEAMLQPHFVAAVFQEAHARGLNTCIDTTGQGTKGHHWDVVLPHTDLVLFCVKQLNPHKYLDLVGHQQATMLKFAEELKTRGIKAWCRYVLVPGLTDDPEDIQMLADYVNKHENMLGVELLPYHRLGVDKWSVMGLKYPLDGCKTPSQAATRSVMQTLEAAGVKVLCDVPTHS